MNQGFNNNPDSNRSSIASDSSIQQGVIPRIPVSGPLLIELLHIIYHAAERNVTVALQALHDVMERATYELYTGINKQILLSILT